MSGFRLFRPRPNYVHGAAWLYWRLGVLVVAEKHVPPTLKT